MTARGDDPLLDCIHMLLRDARDDATVVPSLRDVRAAFLADLLYRRIDTLRDAAVRNHARSLIEAIPDGAVGRFIASPTLCEVLRCDLPEGELLMVLEHAAAGANGGGARAPAHAGGVPIDDSLPAVLSRPHGGLAVPRALEAAEIAAAVARIEAALDLLRSVYGFGGRVFDGLASHFVLRADAMRPQETWGASSGLAMGRILLVNPHISTSPEMLADMLLHEAVHCGLDCAELVRPMFRPAAAAGGTEIPSPWSGNPLSWHALVHATVVWATLLKFWLLLEHRRGGSAQAGRRIAYIAAGFGRFDRQRMETDCRRALGDEAVAAIGIACRYAGSAMP
jgi:hypothetical protein